MHSINQIIDLSVYYHFFQMFLKKCLNNNFVIVLNQILNSYLCAFRRVHGCHTTQLEDWCAALDKNQYIAAVLMDHLKMFYCLPHDILRIVGIWCFYSFGLSSKIIFVKQKKANQNK